VKIFFGNKIIYINNSGSVNNVNAKAIFIASLNDLEKAYTQFINHEKAAEIIFYNENVESLKQWFKSMFTIIEAAGGLVLNEENEYLFIFRKGRWDLPKGKIEKGESIEVAAIREVEEECGVNNLSIIKQLPDTYHIYSLKDKIILKPTYWFLMKTNYNGNLVPQIQEGITKVEWVTKERVDELLINAYESINEVMNKIMI